MKKTNLRAWERKSEKLTSGLGKREMLSSSRKEFDRTAEVAATARCRMLRRMMMMIRMMMMMSRNAMMIMRMVMVLMRMMKTRMMMMMSMNAMRIMRMGPVPILGSRTEPLEMLHKDKNLRALLEVPTKIIVIIITFVISISISISSNQSHLREAPI